jgi:2-polyprenyl-6-hydroxyphenyl methylase/3-demethylubiquinone-9 3-methyltransferase
VVAVRHAPGDYPAGKQGDVFAVEFRVARMSCLGLSDGPVFQYKEPFRSRSRPMIRLRRTTCEHDH